MSVFQRFTMAGICFAAVMMARQGDPFGGFWLHSDTFADGATLPIITINNIVSNGVNGCSINGAAGGDESPQLSWGKAPAGTRSFAVVAFDSTASFTHWGMYNIAAKVDKLPLNAGMLNSTYGAQIVNDFGAAAEYDGPCPPAGIQPYVHQYVFTVYALDEELSLGGSANFPANAETLYQALIRAGQEHHILASAHITGLYSTTPASSPAP